MDLGLGRSEWTIDNGLVATLFPPGGQSNWIYQVSFIAEFIAQMLVPLKLLRKVSGVGFRPVQLFKTHF